MLDGAGRARTRRSAGSRAQDRVTLGVELIRIFKWRPGRRAVPAMKPTVHPWAPFHRNVYRDVRNSRIYLTARLTYRTCISR
jgi:hypothetical protein